MDKAAAFFNYQLERWNRLLLLGREQGLPRLGARVLAYLKEKVYLKNDGYLYELSPLEISYDPRKDSPLAYEVEELKAPADLSGLVPDLTEENVGRRLRNGEHGFVVVHGRKIIGTIWLATRPTYFPGFEFRLVTRGKWIDLGGRTGFAYRGSVDKEFRGHRLLSALYNALILKARELGMEKIVTSAAASNVSMRKGALRSGWKIRCLVRTRRVFGILFRTEIPCAGEPAC